MSCSACRIFSTASTHLAAGSASMMSEAILRASKLLISSHSKIYIQLATVRSKVPVWLRAMSTDGFSVSSGQGGLQPAGRILTLSANDIRTGACSARAFEIIYTCRKLNYARRGAAVVTSGAVLEWA